jgi:hypothetical protein
VGEERKRKRQRETENEKEKQATHLPFAPKETIKK